MKRTILALVATLLLAGGTAQADIAAPGSIANWNQYSMAGNQASTTGTGSSHLTAIDMNRAGGLTANSGNNSLNSSSWTTGGYVQFGFTVDQGYHANLGSLYFASYASATGPKTLEIRTSKDNYTSAIYSISQVQYPNYIDPVVDLSSLGSIVGSFNIRIYGTGATSSGGTMRLTNYYTSSTGYYFDSITGTVAANASPTPIPAAAWLLGSGLMGLAGLRRKQS